MIETDLTLCHKMAPCLQIRSQYNRRNNITPPNRVRLIENVKLAWFFFVFCNFLSRSRYTKCRLWISRSAYSLIEKPLFLHFQILIENPCNKRCYGVDIEEFITFPPRIGIRTDNFRYGALKKVLPSIIRHDKMGG